MKKIILLALVLFSSFFMMTKAQAAIFIDFEEPTFSQDGAGNFLHTLPTAYGDIHFDGNISNTLGGAPLADVTTGTGNFWRNTEFTDSVFFEVTFPLSRVSFNVFGTDNVVYSAFVYDANDNLLFPFFGSLDQQWVFYDTDSLGYPLDLSSARKVAIYSSGAGNNFAVDDVTLYPLERPSTVPEPATMALLAMGLTSGAFLRKKRS